MDNVVGFEPRRRPAPPPPSMPDVRVTGVQWRSMRLDTMPPPTEELAFDGRVHWVPLGAVVCRGRISFTAVLPAMQQPINPEFLGAFENDN